MLHRTCFSIENVFLSFLFYRINTAKTSALPTFSKWKKKQIGFDAIKQQSLKKGTWQFWKKKNSSLFTT